MNELTWYLEEPTPVRRYAAALLTESTGLRPRFADHPPADGMPYVHHGSIETRGARSLVIPRDPDAGSQPPTTVGRVAGGPPWRLDADIVDGTVAHVTDAVHAEVTPGGLDRHGRLRSEAAFMATRGGVTDPVVNRYATVLADALPLLGAFTLEPRWPNAARAAIGLSHDVDRPDKYAVLRAIRSGRVAPPRRLPWYVARGVRDMAHRLRDRHPDDFWLFDEVVEVEAALGFRSTFLFSVVPAYASYGSTNDVLYDAAWPHLRRAMRRLREAGIELGLHASYNAHRDPGRFVSEKARLEELSEGPIRGLRHHFWQVGRDLPRTLRAHEAAGFVYDSSIAFNDAVGLRRGIALPYRPWDAAEGRPLVTWQLPVIALDSAASSGVRDAGEGIDRVWAGIERVVETGGVATLDWHVRCSVPANDRYRTWGQIYVGLLERLARRKDIWVTGLGEIADWATAREARIAARRET